MLDQSIQAELFKDDDAETFAVLDAASWPGLPGVLEGSRAEHACIMRGQLDAELIHVAPYLIRLREGDPLIDELIPDEPRKHRGIIIRASVSFPAVRNHFRDLTQVIGPDGDRLMFRYYDPRVLASFLPTCDATQLGELFGPAIEIFGEREDGPPALMRYWVEESRLRSTPLVPAGATA